VATAGFARSLALLLENEQVDIERLHQRKLSNYSLLVIAASKGHRQAVQAILNLDKLGIPGAELDAAVPITALHWAAVRGDNDMLEDLLDVGADPKVAVNSTFVVVLSNTQLSAF